MTDKRKPLMLGDLVVPYIHRSDMFEGKLCIVRSDNYNTLRIQRISHWGTAAPLAEALPEDLHLVSPDELTDDQMRWVMIARLSGVDV